MAVSTEPAVLGALASALCGDPRIDLTLSADTARALDLARLRLPDLVIAGVETASPFYSDLHALASAGALLPIIAVGLLEDRSARLAAYRCGATGFVPLPLDPEELLLRVQTLLRLRSRDLLSLTTNRALEDAVRERTRAVVEAQVDAVERLAAAAELRDDQTGLHTVRVANLAALLGETLGVERQAVALVRRAAPLHDIGKLSIPDAILLKPGRLTPEEFEVVTRHPTVGARILGGSSSPLLDTAAEIAATHHENWDGTGYPLGLSRELIPLPGRLVAVADVYDALTQARPYKEPWPPEDAVREIASLAGTKFDPAIVEAFLHLARTRRLTPAALETTPRTWSLNSF